MRRLVVRAEEGGTAWDFQAVEAWLDGGSVASSCGGEEQDVGSSRALVVCSGAGEGKSTISAALVAGHLRERFAAYHFFKYSDARRQDPVQVIKSLAFQLASRWGGSSLRYSPLSLFPVPRLTLNPAL